MALEEDLRRSWRRRRRRQMYYEAICAVMWGGTQQKNPSRDEELQNSKPRGGLDACHNSPGGLWFSFFGILIW